MPQWGGGRFPLSSHLADGVLARLERELAEIQAQLEVMKEEP